jgi:hypothetical protein
VKVKAIEVVETAETEQIFCFELKLANSKKDGEPLQELDYPKSNIF